jgi:sulfur-oxidizing protein SoxZ|tara:strand:- start:276 stop:596 length:321 start_codon:yes stop_codon:yes gene_type:complete
MAAIRVAVPSTARKGEVIQIKTLVSHPMDNGFMLDFGGRFIPRWIINRFELEYNGEIVFSADWHLSISTNPYLIFYTVATETGQLDFKWYDDNGDIYTHTAKIIVT